MTSIYAIELPNRPLWTHSALAKHIGSDRKTVRTYVEKVAIAVLDFRKELPVLHGKPCYGMPLSDYQAWVLCQLIFYGRERRELINGAPIHACVRVWATNNAHALSKAAWQACNDVKAA